MLMIVKSFLLFGQEETKPFNEFATPCFLNRPIDIFKIDCESYKWYLFQDWFKADIHQRLVETHGLPFKTNEQSMRQGKLPHSTPCLCSATTIRHSAVLSRSFLHRLAATEAQPWEPVPVLDFFSDCVPIDQHDLVHQDGIDDNHGWDETRLHGFDSSSFPIGNMEDRRKVALPQNTNHCRRCYYYCHCWPRA